MGNIERKASENVSKSHKYDKQGANDLLGFILLPLFEAVFEVIAKLFRFLARKSQTEEEQVPGNEQAGANGWTPTDYLNYEKHLEAQYDYEANQKQALREADLARLDKLIEIAKTHGNVSSISIDENGTHSIVFKNDQE
jgi:hypothetical protein